MARVYGRSWSAVSNVGGFGISSSSGTAIIPSGQRPGQQAGFGVPVPRWVEVQTTPNGNSDFVNLTWLCQILKLSPQESPFYSSAGVPALQSIQQQVPPDYYLAVIQQQFAPLFASLVITRTASNPPTYQINVTTNQGTRLQTNVPIPT
jgi:hypothetical protein